MRERERKRWREWTPKRCRCWVLTWFGAAESVLPEGREVALVTGGTRAALWPALHLAAVDAQRRAWRGGGGGVREGREVINED